MQILAVRQKMSRGPHDRDGVRREKLQFLIIPLQKPGMLYMCPATPNLQFKIYLGNVQQESREERRPAAEDHAGSLRKL